MTDDEIRIAIAGSVGWTKLEVYQQPPEVHIDHEMFIPAPFLRGMPPGPSGIWREPPRYTEDLNAIAGVEKTLRQWTDDPSKDDYGRYVGWLAMITHGCAFPKDSKEQAKLVSATARQRAEAYLRTLGLWKP